MMVNAVKEILNVLKDHAKSEKNISWVGSSDGKLAMSWDDFKENFANIEYDDGFGAQKIAEDLVVVLDDQSWLERGEYDGAEAWDFKQLPQLNSALSQSSYDVIDCDSVDKIGWKTLAELNGGEAEE